MAWTPLSVILTVAGCALIVIPFATFMVAGLIGLFFGRLDKTLSRLFVTVDDSQKEQGQ